MAHNRKHNFSSDNDHQGVLGAVENNILSFNTTGLPKDSGLIKNDSGDTANDLLSANQIDTRIGSGDLKVIDDQSALGFFFSLTT